MNIKIKISKVNNSNLYTAEVTDGLFFGYKCDELLEVTEWLASTLRMMASTL